ncbi:MAG: outer membrane beta-barrel protein [Bacteroidaceae bacterium]|nr:outer membrane beta-barrel protein [Bacteroidaceae bacterium]MBR3854782.1 outer membrane beta-barrel protein [Bacteroidaceae bacterium]
MKRIRNFICAVLFVAAAIMPTIGKAQISLNTYYNIDWQFNIPLGNNFSNVASGWGMNYEGGYYVTPDIAVGAFLSFHTNNEYFSRRTIAINETLSMNSDQQHQMFTMPFGVLARYRLQEADFQPYVGMKLGACYAQFSNYYYIFMSDQNRWGFFMSPEIGFNYYPWANGIGFHMAIYYSFATNKCNLMSYKQDILNNIGFRLGLAF